MRLLKLPCHSGQLLVGKFSLAQRSTGILVGPRRLGLERHRLRWLKRGAMAWGIAHLAELSFQCRQLADVLAVYTLRHVLERSNGLFTRIAFSEAYLRQIEKRHRWCEPLSGAGAKDFTGLIEREDRAEQPFHLDATHRQHPAVQRRGKPAQPRIVRRSVIHIEKRPTRDNGGANRVGEVIKCGLHRGADHPSAAGSEAIPKHVTTGVIQNQRHRRATV